MDLDLPSTLHPTRDLLMRSLVMHSEQAPTLPAGLAADLSARFAPREIAAPQVAPVSWFEKVRGFLSTPAFGAAAAAVVVMGVAVPMISAPADRGEHVFRGATSAITADAVRIVFVGQNPAMVSEITASGDFEAAAITMTESSSTVTGPAVIVDFTTGSLSAVDADGSLLHRTDLSGDASDMAASIASALSRF
jgi:hypothetical protein